MLQNEQNLTSQKSRCKNDELQQITRQNNRMKTQDEKTMIYAGKHVITRTESHITNDVKTMRKQFSRSCSADRGKHDENEMKHQNKTLMN